MGMTLVPVPFFDDNITIIPHTVGNIGWGPFRMQALDRETSIGQFCDGQPCRLELIEETGEYLVTRNDGAFMQGPEC